MLRHYLKMFIVKGIIGGQNLIINYVKKILKFPNVQMLSYVCYILLYIPQWEATSCCWGTRRPQKEVWWELFLWICTKSYLPLLPNPVHTNAMHYAFEYVFPAILLFNKIEIKKNIFKMFLGAFVVFLRFISPLYCFIVNRAFWSPL